MPKLSQIQLALTQTCLIYGPPKVGKTRLVGELAEHDEIEGVIWFDLENGVSTLSQLSAKAQDKIIVVQLPDTRSNPIAIDTCLKVIKGAKVSICEEHGKVNCVACQKANAPTQVVELGKLKGNWIVVFDSITQLTESAISLIGSGKPDDYKFDYDDWANLGKLMNIFLGHVQQAHFNVVCISHEIEAEREDGTIRVVPVAGTRNFSRNSAKFFGHVVYAEVAAKKHVFTSSTTGKANVVSGSRADIKLETMKENASLIDIFRPAALSARKEESQVEEAEVKTEVKTETPAPSSEPSSSKEGCPTPEEFKAMPLMQRIQAKKRWPELANL